MAITPIFNAFRQTSEESGGQPSYMDALLKGFKGAQEAAETANKPKQLAEALLAAKLKNAHDQTINKYLEPSEQARVQGLQQSNALSPLRQKLLEAQINKASRPEKKGELETLLAYAKAQQDEQEQQQGNQSFVPSLNGNNDNNPMPNETKKKPSLYDQIIQHKLDLATGNAKKGSSYAPSITAKELQEQSDAEAGFYPNTNRQQPFESPEKQKSYVDAFSAKTTGLPKSSHYILSPQGERIGVERPKTSKEKEVDRGTAYFNEFYPMVNKGLNRYSGENSIRNMESDARNYKNDPEARKRFDELLLATKLNTLTTVNEAARFGAGKQNQVFNRFNESLSSFDVPKKISKLIKEYDIPASANIKAGVTFSKVLNEAEEKYKNKASPNVSEYYPGKAPIEKGADGEARAMYKNGKLHFIPIADIAEAKKLGYKDER